MIDVIKPLIKQFMPFAQERMGFGKPPRLFVRRDEQNAQNPLGKTAYYDPGAKSVTLYVTGRHPKDVMRSLSHELVHHTQNCNGEFDNVGEMGEGYAQNDSHLREMERQAYEIGNLCFRDWEDSIKQTIYFEHLQKGVEKVMSTKDWKNGELKSLLSEAWGFKMDLSKLNEGTGPSASDGEEQAEEDVEGKDPSGKGKGWEKKGLEEADTDEELKAKCMKIVDPVEAGRLGCPGFAHDPSSPHNPYRESKNLDEMGGCADHGPEDEVVVMQSADEEGPDDPNAIVDELGDLVARLSAALGGEMAPGDEEVEEDEVVVDMMQERIKKAIRKALKETGAGRTGASKDDEGKDEDDPEARDYEHGGDRKGDESETHSGKDYEKHHPHHKVPHGDDSEEKHYEENEMSDDEHLKAIRHHLKALMKDRDYDDEEKEELGERRGRGRKGPHIRGEADPRLREAIKKALKASIVKKNK